VPGFEEGGAVDVSCGLNHTAVITTAGDLMTFGNGSSFKLGHGGKTNISTPTVVEVLCVETRVLDFRANMISVLSRVQQFSDTLIHADNSTIQASMRF
jgi:alpha-tubulin suppressor-like RCC1 family protein